MGGRKLGFTRLRTVDIQHEVTRIRNKTMPIAIRRPGNCTRSSRAGESARRWASANSASHGVSPNRVTRLHTQKSNPSGCFRKPVLSENRFTITQAASGRQSVLIPPMCFAELAMRGPSAHSCFAALSPLLSRTHGARFHDARPHPLASRRLESKNDKDLHPSQQCLAWSRAWSVPAPFPFTENQPQKTADRKFFRSTTITPNPKRSAPRDDGLARDRGRSVGPLLVPCSCRLHRQLRCPGKLCSSAIKRARQKAVSPSGDAHPPRDGNFW